MSSNALSRGEAGPVAAGLARQGLAPDVEIVEARREPSPWATVFPADVLSVTLSNGETRAFFVKCMGEEEADHPDKTVRDRELQVYEQLLGADGLPVPSYYGSRWNTQTRRREIFLEYVDGWNLKYHGLEVWFEAAAQLGRLHAHFAKRVRSLLDCDALLRFDASYFHVWAERARDVVVGRSRQLARSIDDVRRAHNGAIRIMASQPVTLVHNDLSPKNVIAIPGDTSTRIYVVDWELGGIGCGFLDLVHLRYGLGHADGERMLNTYCRELVDTPLLPRPASALASIVAACELHKCLYRLARADAWQMATEKVADWLREARDLAARI